MGLFNALSNNRKKITRRSGNRGTSISGYLIFRYVIFGVLPILFILQLSYLPSSFNSVVSVEPVDQQQEVKQSKNTVSVKSVEHPEKVKLFPQIPTTTKSTAITTTLSTGSETATVMGMATGYGTGVFKSFVGSLRRSGFKGNIILGVSPNMNEESKAFLTSRNVTMKTIETTPCTYKIERDSCAKEYPDIKLRWSRFPLIRDWLQECEACTGPVLITDVRDTFFQDDPFGVGAPVVEGLQVFEENPIQTTMHWLIDVPVKACKGISIDKPMLCSGSTIGTRDAMIKYLERMYEEMKAWISEPKCREFKGNGDDQSIHNYLYYTGQFPYATAILPRSGIVNTVGVDGANILKAHKKYWESQGKSPEQIESKKFNGAEGENWLGKVDFLQYELTDSEGFFVNVDGSRSRMIHQYDRFGNRIEEWLGKQTFFVDTKPGRN